MLEKQLNQENLSNFLKEFRGVDIYGLQNERITTQVELVTGYFSPETAAMVSPQDYESMGLFAEVMHTADSVIVYTPYLESVLRQNTKDMSVSVALSKYSEKNPEMVTALMLESYAAALLANTKTAEEEDKPVRAHLDNGTRKLRPQNTTGYQFKP